MGPDIEQVSLRFCGNRRKNLVPLADYDPELAQEWNYKKNCGWGPEDFSHGSSVRAWWTCPYCLCDYQKSIYSRTIGSEDCPNCVRTRVREDNVLAGKYPHLVKEWHPRKNGDLTPDDVPYASNKAAWWLCSRKHEFKAIIYSRTTMHSGCPHCYKEDRQYLKEHSTKSPRNPVVLDGDKRIRRNWYESGKSKYTPLSESHPEIASQWHPTANGSWKPSDFASASSAVVWWKCKSAWDHQWQSAISVRTLTSPNCPFCVSKRVSRTNSLQSLFPKIADQWHDKRNGTLTPETVAARSQKKVWWQCIGGVDHVWEATVADRTTKGSGCPFCAGARASKEHNLKALFPHLAAQWHPERNGDLKPEQVTPGSKRKIWWICTEGPDHQWQAPPKERTGRGSGCSFCAGKKVSVTNSLAVLFPAVASQWHKTKNGESLPSDFTSRSNKLVWWQCQSGHSWQATIVNRTQNKSGCPDCRWKHQTKMDM